MKIKVQRICWCTQCEKILPTKCEKCVAHPERKPRVVELYGVPPVIDTNACGCVKIRCQREGCIKTKWIHPRADGTLGRKNHFCSPECVRVVTAAAKVAKRVAAPCSCGCGRVVMRPASNMKAKKVYFSQLCHFKDRKRANSERRSEEPDYEGAQTIACYSNSCRGEVVEHRKVAGKLYECVRCHKKVREAPLGEAGRR